MLEAGYMTRVQGYLVPVGSLVGDGFQLNFLRTKYARKIRSDKTSTIPTPAVQTNYDDQTSPASNEDVSNDDIPDNEIPTEVGEEECTIEYSLNDEEDDVEASQEIH